ncbi:MAG: pilus assembly protein [Planctomycetaceae bacterium]
MKRLHRTIRTSSATSRRGVAAVEAAVIMPVLILLVMGTIEIGTALRASTIMQSATREAGRLVNTDWRDLVGSGDSPNAKLERDLRNFVTASGLPGNQLVITVTHAEGDNVGQPFDLLDGDNQLQLINITMTLNYAHISLFPNRYMGGANVTASLIMRAGMGGGLSN